MAVEAAFRQKKNPLSFLTAVFDRSVQYLPKAIYDSCEILSIMDLQKVPFAPFCQPTVAMKMRLGTNES